MNEFKFAILGQNELGRQALVGAVEAGKTPLAVLTRVPSDYENTVVDAAKSFGIPIVFTEDVNSEKTLDILTRLDLDFVMCAAWGQRIHSKTFRTTRMQWINFHTSYLPEYRGSSPLTWYLINGEKEAGCTAHFMNEDFDSGRIIVRTKVPILAKDNAKSLKLRCGHFVRSQIGQALQVLEAAPDFKGIEQDETIASYFPPRPTRFFVREDISAEQNLRYIRGLAPYPCAITSVNGKEVRVLEAHIQEQLPKSEDTYLACSDGKFIVFTEVREDNEGL